MMGNRLERFSEVMIVDETNSFGLDFVNKTENGIRAPPQAREQKDRLETCEQS